MSQQIPRLAMFAFKFSKMVTLCLTGLLRMEKYAKIRCHLEHFWRLMQLNLAMILDLDLVMSMMMLNGLFQ